ncbi:MAG: hypothetical protein G8237_09750 [Magnetococcales bacterium]|nr:hypothetical protein [Magnetococcales bacterium]NGZ06627.1 hypothetical protein [Magnetococcales bacterium]
MKERSGWATLCRVFGVVWLLVWMTGGAAMAAETVLSEVTQSVSVTGQPAAADQAVDTPMPGAGCCQACCKQKQKKCDLSSMGTGKGCGRMVEGGHACCQNQQQACNSAMQCAQSMGGSTGNGSAPSGQQTPPAHVH